MVSRVLIGVIPAESSRVRLAPCRGVLLTWQGHVNNISYNRYAETSRINYIRLLANRDAEGNKQRWMDLWTPRGKGLILKNIKTYFKHVRLAAETGQD
jgi:hypothetical protein